MPGTAACPRAADRPHDGRPRNVGAMNHRPPIIVMGMHRSGTSMVMRLLQELGVFAGWRLEENHESRFFLRLNRWIMTQAGASWDYPDPARELPASPDARAMIVGRLDRSLNGVESVEYLGLRRWLRFRSPGRIPAAWGWKDPRNTFTLPFWLDLFPQALCLHVRRHGVDVAASLRARRARSVDYLGAASASLTRRGLASWISADSAGLVRCRTLEGCFSLWLAYVGEARRHADTLQDRYHEVAYEALLADPRSVLRELARFGQLEVSDETIAGAAGLIRTSRRFAYRQTAELEAFAERRNGELARFGY